MNEVPLHALAEGESGTVCALHHSGSMRRRLQDIGLVTGTRVTCVGHAPGGDPAAYRICGAVIAIRHADAAAVTVIPEGRDAV